MTDHRSPLAKARDDWFEHSKEAEDCLKGDARGRYLRNRLERAFIAGWEARDAEVKRLRDLLHAAQYASAKQTWVAEGIDARISAALAETGGES